MKRRPGRICPTCGIRHWSRGSSNACSKICYIACHIGMMDDCWVWEGNRTSLGYGRFRLNSRQVLVHRMIYEWFVDTIPDGLVVRHTCDNPSCVNIDHLKPGTHKENTSDIWARGRNIVRLGSNNTQAKLREDDVLCIRERLSNGETQTSIAGEYGLDRSTISDIKRRKNWKHI